MTTVLQTAFAIAFSWTKPFELKQNVLLKCDMSKKNGGWTLKSLSLIQYFITTNLGTSVVSYSNDIERENVEDI